MSPDSEFIASLISTDIIVWNGVTSRWGSIKEFVLQGDMVRLPDKQEEDFFRQKQKTHQAEVIAQKTCTCSRCRYIHLLIERHNNPHKNGTHCPRCGCYTENYKP